MHIRQKELTFAHETYKSANISPVFCYYRSFFFLLWSQGDAREATDHSSNQHGSSFSDLSRWVSWSFFELEEDQNLRHFDVGEF